MQQGACAFIRIIIDCTLV